MQYAPFKGIDVHLDAFQSMSWPENRTQNPESLGGQALHNICEKMEEYIDTDHKI